MASQNLTPTDMIEQGSPGDPPAGFLRLFAKADHKPWVRDSTGAETDLTAAGGSASRSFFLA